MLNGSLEAIGMLLDPFMIGVILFATVVGTVAAILPGISPGTMMALLIPLTFGMDRFEALAFLVALMAAGGFAGSMTSILLNVPGDGINAATLLDGFPLARQGKAGLAIGAAAAASALGAIFGLFVLIVSIPFIRPVILAFGPPEFFALAVAGVLLIATVSARFPLRGIAAGLLGMAIGFVGVNYTVGGTRYTLGVDQLEDGIRLVPALIGLFAIPEIFNLLRRDEAISQTGLSVAGGVWRGVKEVLVRPFLLLRSALIGTGIGIIPGVGGSVASWVAYFAAVNSSKDPDSYGKGNIEGVIAPEASIDAKEGGSMIAVLALGLPASVSTAILLTAFQIHGVFPGAQLFQNDMTLVWVLVFSMVFANVSTSVLGLAFANQMVKITLVPGLLLAPFILALGAIGSFADQRSLFGLALMLIFGGLGVVMAQTGFPRPPLLVGLILLPLAEVNFHRATQIYRGDLTWLLRPLTLIIFALALIIIVIPFVRSIRRNRRSQLEQGPGARGQSRNSLLLQTAFVAVLLVVAGAMLLGALTFEEQARLFPLMVLSPLLVLLTLLVVNSVRQLVKWQPSEIVEPDAEGGERSYWWIGAWIAVLVAFVLIFGVLLGSSLYIATFLLFFDIRQLRPRRVVLAIAGAVGMQVAMHYAFVVALGIRFYEGIV